MAAVPVRVRRAIVFLVLATLSTALLACSPAKPPAPPAPPAETTPTPATTSSAPPVEYTGPELEPKRNEVTLDLHTPETGSAERKAILDALRGPVEKDLGQPVIFKVLVIRAQGRWAYVRATPLKPDGSRIDYTKTAYREQVENGAFDDAVDALVQNTGGSWRTVANVLGATDVAWSPWPEQFGAPQAIFATP